MCKNKKLLMLKKILSDRLINQKIESLNERFDLLEKKFLKLNLENLSLEDILKDFIKENIIIKNNSTLAFDKNLNRYGIYVRFIKFYLLHYSFVPINLENQNVLEEFEKALVENFDYNLSKDRVLSTNVYRDALYKNLQFKKALVFEKTNIDLNFIMEKFIHERIEFSFENNKLFFDTKLLNRGIYLKFLQFYFLDFSFVEVNLNAKNILIVFEASLVKILSYDLFVYRTIQKTLKRDIIYRNLQFKKI
jgi:hypothetical protein